MLTAFNSFILFRFLNSFFFCILKQVLIIAHEGRNVLFLELSCLFVGKFLSCVQSCDVLGSIDDLGWQEERRLRAVA